ncbi:MAG TPA: bacterioferritin [Vicinamibacterales bacterium]|jgi:bacterioferritin
MKAKEGVVSVLNTVLAADLAAISQYFVQAKLCQHWGYERLHRELRMRSIRKMKEADRLIGHILYLEALPKVQRPMTILPGETVSEQLQRDRQAEQDLLTLLGDGVRHCATVADFTTRHLLEHMAQEVDAQVDWLEMQLDTMAELGIEQYLAEQSMSDR